MGPFGSDPSDHPSFYDPHYYDAPECRVCDGRGAGPCIECDGAGCDECAGKDSSLAGKCRHCEGTGEEPDPDADRDWDD
jgi:hypothetical protein